MLVIVVVMAVVIVVLVIMLMVMMVMIVVVMIVIVVMVVIVVMIVVMVMMSISMIMTTPLTGSMSKFMHIFRMQNRHLNKVEQKAKPTRDKHNFPIYFRRIQKSERGLIHQPNRNRPNEQYADESAEHLRPMIPKSMRIISTSLSNFQRNYRNANAERIRCQMSRIRHNRDGVGEPTAKNLNANKQNGHDHDTHEFLHSLLVIFGLLASLEFVHRHLFLNKILVGLAHLLSIERSLIVTT